MSAKHDKRAHREKTQHEPRTSEGMQRATGRDRDEWFAQLDAWGATDREYREIAEWLVAKHGLSKWWAQKLTVEYEEARGMRAPGVRSGGTFTVTASKTVTVPVERLFKAFVDPELRERWLPGAVMRERTSQPGRSVRFDWEDGEMRVNVGFTAEGAAKSQVAVEHERLPHTKAKNEARAYWRERLAALKALLEG
ncbi:MAG: DUF4287 domain-containing protein [Luteitalea sp.]|nr:DUF4287 domain-containing protein [Luteitalea sp.]